MMSPERLEEIEAMSSSSFKMVRSFKIEQAVDELLAEVKRLRVELDDRLHRAYEEGGASLVNDVWAGQAWRVYECEAKGWVKEECVSYGNRSDTWIEHDPALAHYIRRVKSARATSAAEFLIRDGSGVTPVGDGNYWFSLVPGSKAVVMWPYELEREASKRGWSPQATKEGG